MSPVVCPDGHASQATDYCDVCGAPIASTADPGAAGPAASSSVPAAAAGPTTCPNCQAPAAPGALFCENCGYDFTTGTAPLPSAPTPVAAGADAAAPGETSADPSAAPGLPTPAPDGAQDWVAEVWIDPDWYAVQSPEDPLPSVGLPVLVPLRTRSVLVGRPSASRNIHPQIDCGTDSGVSRRHCQLNTDGVRWWVEDLQSSNGTYVARVGEPLPDAPIPPGQRHELMDGDRVYVGAWTRVVVRRALPGEV